MTLTFRGRGFALPTVLITSVAMMIVLLVALTASSSVTASFRDQYYTKVAKEAAEAGLVMAQTCIANNSEADWSGKNLAPNTDCSGKEVTGASKFVIDTPLVKTTFSVPYPAGTGTRVITATGTVSTYRQSQPTGSAVQSKSTNMNIIVGRPIDTTNILIGATAPFNGSVNMHYGIVLPTGEVKMAGYNGDGRLGIGNTNTIYVPQNFRLPAGELGVKGYSSLVAGQQTFIVTASGNVYAAGNNTTGALGIGSMGGNISTPQKVQLPSGVKIKLITTTQTFGNTDTTTFFMGDDNKIYSVGSCAYGVLGNGAGISGCSNTSIPQPIANLPTPDTNNDNTIPSDMVVGNAMFVRMKGGAVYSWGRNNIGTTSLGVLGRGAGPDTSTPTRVGNFGDSGQPMAKQVASDGQMGYIIDENGNVYTFGFGRLGNAGSTPMAVRSNSGSSLCITNAGALGAQLQMSTCNDTNVNQQLIWYPDGTIRVRPSLTTEYCLGAANTTNDGALITKTCSASDPTQQWFYDSDPNQSSAWDRIIRNKNDTTMCINRHDGWWNTNNLLYYAQCNWSGSGWNSVFYLDTIITSPRKMVLPSNLQVLRIVNGDASTFMLVRDTNTNSTKLYGFGVNDSGQFGLGTTKRYNPAPVLYANGDSKFTNSVVDINVTQPGQTYDTSGAGSATRNNTTYNTFLVTLSDGSVYGTGSNLYGQLGNESALGAVPNYNSQPTPPPPFVTTPAKMLLPTGVKAAPNGGVRTADGTTIVITTGGAVYTVGNNNTGQLGDGSTTNSSTPAARPYYKVPVPTIY